MNVVMEHCDDKGVELCDDKGHGALRLQGSWSILMTGAMETFDAKPHGTL